MKELNKFNVWWGKLNAIVNTQMTKRECLGKLCVLKHKVESATVDCEMQRLDKANLLDCINRNINDCEIDLDIRFQKLDDLLYKSNQNIPLATLQEINKVCFNLETKRVAKTIMGDVAKIYKALGFKITNKTNSFEITR